MKRKAGLLFLMLCIAMSACSGGDVPENTSGLSPSPSAAASSPEPTASSVPTANTQTLQGAAEVFAGESIKLTLPDGAQGAVWTSSDPYRVAVDQSGVVTGRRKSGGATVTAQTANGSYVWDVTNTATMRDISPQELVDDIKVGFNYAADPFFNMVEFWKETDNYAYTSLPVSVQLQGAGFQYQMLPKQRQLRKGDQGPLSIVLPSVIQDGTVLTFSLGFGLPYCEGGSAEVKVNISDARIVTQDDSEYLLEDFNGTHVVQTYAGIQDDYWVEPQMWGSVVAIHTPALDAALLENAMLEMYIEVIDAPMPDDGRWDYVLGIPDNLRYFDEMKAAGYNAIRLPSTIGDFMDVETGVINEFWFEQLEKIIGYITSLDMYCVLTFGDDFAAYNSERVWVGDHFASDWLIDEYKPYIDERFEAIWLQVAERFKDYDDYLIFQSANEPGMYHEIPGMSGDEIVEISVRRLNELNDIFVKAVRSTGGNNEKRLLNIAGFQTTPFQWSVKDLVLPQDDRISLSMHCYPTDLEAEAWSSANKRDTEYADSIFDFVKEFQENTGVPVIMDEWGHPRSLDEASRIDVTRYFIGKANALGVPCFYWEDNYSTGGWRDISNFSLRYDMQNKQWQYAEIFKAMMDTVYGQE